MLSVLIVTVPHCCIPHPVPIEHRSSQGLYVSKWSIYGALDPDDAISGLTVWHNRYISKYVNKASHFGDFPSRDANEEPARGF